MNNKAMEQIETASVDELRGLQLERMKKHYSMLIRTVRFTRKSLMKPVSIRMI